jgi:hypothetical protein
MSYEGEREHYDRFSRKLLRVKGDEGMRDYVARHNEESIDGLPAVPQK